MRHFSALIQNWYRLNGRNLPWRSTNDPYKIWLSEIILQQTRVDQGMAYYLKFIEHYPTVDMLANASEDAVLNDWQGLGYYSRARNLHTAAKFIHEQLNDVFPENFDSVITLKGVGDYTASAICSFAYNQPHAVVDGNVYRVLSRYLEIKTPIDSVAGKKQFKEVAEELLDPENPGTHNQAMMELGALVCTPSNPSCEECPVGDSCMSNQHHSQAQFPVKEKKTKVRPRYFHYLILLENEKLYIKKRGPKDIWQGLYDFPVIEMQTNRLPEKSDFEGFELTEIKEDGSFKHILSHQHIFATFWLCKGRILSPGEELLHIHINDLENYPLPQLLIRYLQSSTQFIAD